MAPALTAYIATRETFSLSGRQDETQRLFGDVVLGLKGLSTTFKDVALEEDLGRSTFGVYDPGRLFDSGASFCHSQVRLHVKGGRIQGKWPVRQQGLSGLRGDP